MRSIRYWLNLLRTTDHNRSPIYHHKSARWLRPEVEVLETRALLSTTGLLITEGDRAQRSDLARAINNYDGSGITVGILSDSFNVLGGYAQDVANGELPPDVQILFDAPSGGGIDEGRAMAQIIHDVAPGARIAFYSATAGFTQTAFANGIRALAAAGADVIIDDIFLGDEPFFQDGVIAQTINDVVAQGVAYFVAAGNNARVSYEASFAESGVAAPIGFLDRGGILHDFDPGPGVDPYQQLTIPANGTLAVTLQWDQPFASISPQSGGAVTDLDAYLYDATGAQIIARATTANVGADPVETLTYRNPGAGPQTVQLAISRFAGPAPGKLKYIVIQPRGITIDEYRTDSSGMFGHALAVGAAAVGAAAAAQTPAYGVSPPLLEPFSSAGGTPILFDANGQHLPAPAIRQQPRFVAPDRVSTSLPPPFKSFFGTSAAVPHAGGVAALLLQANPGLAPAQLYAALAASAVDMDDPATPGFDDGYDFATGYGLIQADRALAAIRTTAISGHVYQERDNDGQRDTEEAGLAGAVVYLDRNNNGQLDTGEPQTRTDARGKYLFTELTPGRYQIRVVPPTGYAPTSAALIVADLAKNQAFQANFLVSAAGAITGQVVRDRDGDGALSSDEPGLAGVHVYLDTNGNGTFDQTTATYAATGPATIPTGTIGNVSITVTDAAARIGDLDVTLSLTLGNTMPGFQFLQVSLVSPSGTSIPLTPSLINALAPGAGFRDTTLDDEAERSINEASVPYTGRFKPTALPLGTFDDENPNGTWLLQVTNFTGVPVDVQAISLHVFAVDEPFTTTDGDGNYNFNSLAPGSYGVGVQPPDGYIQTFPATVIYQVPLSAGARFRGDFGLREVAAPSGRVTHDLDADGTIEPEEPGRAGLPVYADLNGNGIWDRTPTGIAYAGPPVAFGGLADTPLQIQIPLLVIDAAPLVADVNVTLNLNAQGGALFTSALEITLIAPSGRRVRLFTDALPGGGANFADVTFDDQAILPARNATLLVPQDALVTWSGHFLPADSLAALAREAANGIWTLEVRNASGAFAPITGELRGWSLELTSTAEPFVLTNATGAYDFVGVSLPDEFVLRVASTAGFVTTTPAAGGYLVNLSEANVAERDFGIRRVNSIGGTTFRDLNRDGRQQSNEPGLAGVAVFLDENGNGEWDTHAFRSTDVPKRIPTEGTGNEIVSLSSTTISTIVVSGAGTIQDLNVEINVTHTNDADLLFILIAPNGERIILADSVGGPGDDFTATLFDDQAGVAITAGQAPFHGRFRPQQPLAGLIGQSGNGTWTLEIHDRLTGDTGELVGWSLQINPEPGATTDAGGHYEFTDLAPGNYRVVALAPPGFVPGSATAIVGVAPGATIIHDIAFRDPAAPRVVDIVGRWGIRSASLLRDRDNTLPWFTISALDILFSEAVQVDRDDFALFGLDPGDANWSFAYDPTTFIVTLRLPPGRAFGRGTFVLAIDGDAAQGDGNSGVHDNASGQSPGNFLARGDLRVPFRVLPGDVTGDGRVNLADAAAAWLFARFDPTNPRADLNGDGSIDQTDLLILASSRHSKS